jgi:transposase
MNEPTQAQLIQAVNQACLPQTLSQCHVVIAGLMLRVNQLSEQVELLQERINLDSSNSSKPPSSNGPGRGNRTQRRSSARKRGAQPGHQGSSRGLLDEGQVDQVIDCPAAEVCDCGAAVVTLADGPLRHQVFDVPPVQAQVHEYRRYAGRCTGCGKAHRGALPAGVPRGQIGPRALALIGTLGTHYHLTQFKIRDLLARLLGVDFSVGAISQAHGKVALALQAPVAQIATAVEQAPLKHLDETSYPREGRTGNWAWGVVIPQAALYSLLPSRARYVAHELIGQQPTGTVVSDRYAVYDYVDVSQRQVCWAHLLRDFNRIGQRSGEAGRIGRGLLGAGYVLFRWREQGKSAAQFEPLCRRVKRLLQRGTKVDCKRTNKTCANMLKLELALWSFLRDPTVPPTNNEAERALRALVLKRKISGPTRSKRADEFIACGFSVYETCRRQGRDLWGFMHEAVLAWIDKTTPPSLVPTAAPTG